jgi:hypothetical protein
MAEIKIKDKTVIVDDGLLEYLQGFSWSVDPCGYAVQGRAGYPKRMHHHVMLLNGVQVPDGTGKGKGGVVHEFSVDHVNGNPLDNRFCNLRLATSQQQKMNQKARSNKTGFKCVGKHQPSKNTKWPCETYFAKLAVTINGKKIVLRRYHKDPAYCAELYDMMAIQIFGSFARLNFPDRKEGYLERIKAGECPVPAELVGYGDRVGQPTSGES